MRSPSRIKKLASETAVYGVSSVVGRLINFLLFPFYSQVFPPDVYNPIVVIYTAFVFLNILYQHGMESSYLKFASGGSGSGAESGTTTEPRTSVTSVAARNAESEQLITVPKGRDRVYGSAMASIAAISGLLTVLMLTMPEWTADLITLDIEHTGLLTWAAAILALDAFAAVPFADLRLSNRPWLFAAIRTVNILINVGLNLYLILGRGMGVEAVFIANAVASASTLLLLAPQIIRKIGWPERGLFIRMWKFGYPFILGGLGYAVTERLNIFFLGEMSPERAVELYGDQIGNPQLLERFMADPVDYVVGVFGGIIKLAVLMALFVQMFRYAWQPFFLQRGQDSDAPELFGRVFVLFSVVLATVFLSVSFLADEFVQIPIPGRGPLITEAYWMGLGIIPIALAGYVFQGWYYHFSAGAYLKNKSGFLLPSSLAGSAVALILNAWLVPKYGMEAAALATACSYFVASFTLFSMISRTYPVPYSWGRVGLIMGIAATLFALWISAPALQMWPIEIGLIFGFAALSLWIARPTLRIVNSIKR